MLTEAFEQFCLDGNLITEQPFAATEHRAFHYEAIDIRRGALLQPVKQHSLVSVTTKVTRVEHSGVIALEEQCHGVRSRMVHQIGGYCELTDARHFSVDQVMRRIETDRRSQEEVGDLDKCYCPSAQVQWNRGMDEAQEAVVVLASMRQYPDATEGSCQL